MDTYQVLRDELLNDPENMGYAAAIAAADWNKVNDLLNTGTANTKILRRDSVSKGEFLLAILPAIAKIGLLEEPKQRMWDRFLSVINANNEFDLTNNGILALFQQGILDGILTQEEVNAIRYRNCDRLEYLGLKQQGVGYMSYSKSTLSTIIS